MFTDLADYTAAVSRSDREGLRRLLTEHEATVRPVVERYGGVVVKNIGDSFMCLFWSATEGLRAAMDLQDTLDRGDRTLRIRIGLNTGDVEEKEGDAFGDPVNQAARIMAKADAGEIWFGPGTRACMNAAEIPWEPAGRYALKGLPGETDTYRAVSMRRCRLPEAIRRGVKQHTLVRIQRGQKLSPIPSDAVILLEGFEPGSVELQEMIAEVPVVDPAHIWLSAYHISPQERHVWTDAGCGLVIATPAALERALEDAARTTTRKPGSDTVIFDLGETPVMGAGCGGIALPLVPLSDIVAGYNYALSPDTCWVHHHDAALCLIDVDSDGVFVRACVPGLSLGGRPLDLDARVAIQHLDVMHAAGKDWVYRELEGSYRGVLVGGITQTIALHEGDDIELGREPVMPGITLAEREGTVHIRWCGGPRGARARGSGFTLDRALVGRRQATFEVVAGDVMLRQIHERLPTWVLPHAAQHLERITTSKRLSPGDAVIVGTHVVALLDAAMV